jgi:glutamyl-tRNA synthetase
MMMKSDEEIADLFIKAEGIRQKAEIGKKLEEAGSREWLVKVVGLVKERAEFVKDLWSQSWFFFEAPTAYDEATIKKRWTPEIPEVLNSLALILETNFCLLPSALTPHDYESLIKGYITEHNLNLGQIMNVLRLCLVGAPMGPGVFDIMALLGPQEVVSRIRKAADKIS